MAKRQKKLKKMLQDNKPTPPVITSSGATKLVECIAKRNLMGVAKLAHFKGDVLFLDKERADVLSKQGYIEKR